MNRKRAKARREKDFGAKAEWIRGQRCALWLTFQCEGDTVPAHWKSRGAGGDSRDLIPLCWKHHTEQHSLGVKSFQAKYNFIDYGALAQDIEAVWLEIQRSVSTGTVVQAATE